MPTRALSTRLAKVEQTAIVLWQASQARPAPIVVRADPPAYTAVLSGVDRVLAAIADGAVSAMNGVQIEGVWYFYLRPWHTSEAEAAVLWPWCNWIQSAIGSLPLDERPRSTAAYAAWIMEHREFIARRAAGVDHE